jgi:pimeloyl-ACP methyl ester carboxylesterase
MIQSETLAVRAFGGPTTGPQVVFLHGLLGSSRNWQTLTRLLQDTYCMRGFDLRNHGSSPHTEEMSYPAMALDVYQMLQTGEAVHLVGHSMGGKVAMRVACLWPECVASLTVVDIAPRAYPARWQAEFAAMQRMPVTSFSRRTEAEEWLEKDISDWAFRKFLVSNLERCETGGFRWIINLATLERALPALFQPVPTNEQTYAGPTLFVRGERSRFVSNTDTAQIQSFFPNARIETVPNAGHNVHFDQPIHMAALLREHIPSPV